MSHSSKARNDAGPSFLGCTSRVHNMFATRMCQRDGIREDLVNQAVWRVFGGVRGGFCPVGGHLTGIWLANRPGWPSNPLVSACWEAERQNCISILPIFEPFSVKTEVAIRFSAILPLA